MDTRRLADWLIYGEFQIRMDALPSWVEDLEQGRCVQDWYIDFTIRDAPDRLPENINLDGDPTPAAGGSVHVTPFRMSGTLIDLGVGDLGHVMDRKDVDLAEFIDLAVSDFVEDANLLLVVNRARVAPPLRGLGGIGRHLIHEGIRAVGFGRSGVLTATLPFPYTVETPTLAERRAVKHVWESMGFVKFDKKIWIRDEDIIPGQCEARAHELLG